MMACAPPGSTCLGAECVAGRDGEVREGGREVVALVYEWAIPVGYTSGLYQCYTGWVVQMWGGM